jgi:hypothetical protein
MAKETVDLTIPTKPQWETRAKRPLTGGIWPGTDNSLWLWRSVPLSSVRDARSPEDAVNVGYPLLAAYSELSRLAGRGKHRRQAKQSYRETHALLLNIPELFKPKPTSPIRDHLAREFGGQEVLDRVLLFGVKLRPSIGTGTWLSAVESVAETFQHGGAPLSDYGKDIEAISSALSRAGFNTPREGDQEFASALHLADSWWNWGRSAGVPVLWHEEHIHYFSTVAAGKRATAVDPADCVNWPEQREEHAISFAAVDEFDLRVTDAKDALSRWVMPLIDQGARVVSVRALVEPATVTREELRSQQRRYRQDLQELAEQRKMDRQELYDREAETGMLESVYATGGPATLHEASVIIGFSGVVEDIEKLAPPGIVLSSMTNRQPAAWHETMVCSNVRANPHIHDLPANTIAFSGLPSLSRVGDADGALLGLTEQDRQPAYVNHRAVADEHTYPLMAVYGASGSGKSAILQLIADQYHRAGVPQLIVNPQQGATLAGIAEYSGWRRMTLDAFVSSDGGLDPIRTIPPDEESGSRAEAITKAQSMIANVIPPRDAFDLNRIGYTIDWGVKAGATATGQALMLAREAGKISAEITDPIFEFAEYNPQFRATFGMHPSSDVFSLSHGTTLIEVGSTSLTLPPPGWAGEPGKLTDPAMRTSMNLIRMLIWGGMAALRLRNGVIHFDEAWIMEKAAPEDLDAVGRLARKWRVLPMMYTQKPSGQESIGLKGYISRALIGHIKDADEARAALRMFDLEDNTEYLRRITAPRYLSDGAGLNWDSLQSLPNPNGRGVARGSVFYFADLRNRVAPVEVNLSDDFIRRLQLTPQDLSRRKLEEATTP